MASLGGSKIGPPASSLTPPPASGAPPNSSGAPQVSPNTILTPNAGGPSSLEMLLVERAKQIQQANPLKVFADMQGKLC